MKFTIFVDPFLVIITMHLFFWTMPLSRKEEFLRNTSNLHFFPQNYLLLGWGGREIYNFLSPYPKDATYQIWLGLAQ